MTRPDPTSFEGQVRIVVHAIERAARLIPQIDTSRCDRETRNALEGLRRRLADEAWELATLTPPPEGSQP